MPDIWEHLAPHHMVFQRLMDIQKCDTGVAFACRQQEQRYALITNFRASIEHSVRKRR